MVKPLIKSTLVIVLTAFILSMGLATKPVPIFNGATYYVEEILYEAPIYSFSYTLDTAPQYTVSSDFVLFSKEASDEDWNMIGGLSPYEIDVQKLYPFFFSNNNKVFEVIDQVELIYRADDHGEISIFYLVMQTSNDDLLLALGYDFTDNPHVRWLFKLNKISRN